MNIVIKINTDNAAFQDEYLNSQVSGILKGLSSCIAEWGIPEYDNFRDINGNVCGYIKIESNEVEK